MDSGYVALLTMQSAFKGQSKRVLLMNTHIFMLLYIGRMDNKNNKFQTIGLAVFFVTVH